MKHVFFPIFPQSHYGTTKKIACGIGFMSSQLVPTLSIGCCGVSTIQANFMEQDPESVNFNMPQSKRTTTTGFRCWLV